MSFVKNYLPNICEIENFYEEDDVLKILEKFKQSKKWDHIIQKKPDHYSHVFKNDSEYMPDEKEPYLSSFWRNDNLSNDQFIKEKTFFAIEKYFYKLFKIKNLEIDIRCHKFRETDFFRIHMDGYAGGYVSMSNLINTSGVVASDVSGVGTVRNHMGASTYGTGLAIFAYGATTGTSMISISNKVSNVGVIAADVGSLAGTARWGLAAAGYGADKGVFAYGKPSGSITNVKNLLSNTGTMASDVSGVGTARNKPGAVTYSLSA